MPQAVWTGQLSFGLVNIPVKLYGATSPRTVRFHQYEAGTGRRVRYRRVAAGTAPATYEVPAESEDEGLPAAGAGTGIVAPSPTQADDESYVDPHAPREAQDETADDPPPAEAVSPAEVADEDAEVPWERIVKGFEIEPGRVVTVTREELEAQAPLRSRVLEVEQFVELREIDPIHFDKSYYVVPQTGALTERPYWLLYRAMESAGKVAIGRFVMRTKEHLVAIRPGEQVLILETLFYADEVRDPREMWRPLVEEPSSRELEMARQLIESLTFEWEPSRFRDTHRERVLELLRDKSGDAFEPEKVEEQEDRAGLIDLMAALEASVEAARRARREESDDTGTGSR